MSMKKIIILLGATMFSLSMRAQNFSVIYSFDSVKTTTGRTDPTPIVSPTGVTFSAFTAAGVSVNPNASSRFSYTGWGTGALNAATSYGSLTGALDTAKYFQVTVTPSPGYFLDLKTVSFTVQRSGTGIRTYAVRSSDDKYTTNLPASVVPADTNLTIVPGNVFFVNKDMTTALSGTTITFSGGGFTNRGSPLTLRFYGYNAESAVGTFSLDNVIVTGQSILATGMEVNPLPECFVYPNPSASGSFVIDLGTVWKRGVLTVCTMQGRSIYRSDFAGSGKLALDLPDAVNGMYFLTIQTETNIVSRTLAISR